MTAATAQSTAQAAAEPTAQHDIDSPESLARRRHGQSVLSRIDGHAGEAVIDSLADISPALGHHVAAFAFGDIYDRPGLDPRSRQLVTLGVLTALGGCEPQLKVHIGAALNVGISREEITEALLHAAVYCGFPRALNATTAAREAFADRDRDDDSNDSDGTR
ncbi:carboxymuconolactone decarboxylase family protein [Streptomyces sp. CA2R106]|uniref:carboxymuconolactone decarboxylase family protein n=1 Tax=Streptomyces sp. CA2R106 TaxID=3120153 RepID=UPI00300964B5